MGDKTLAQCDFKVDFYAKEGKVTCEHGCGAL